MKSGDFKISVEHIQWGQPRPYADSIREGYVYAEWIPHGKTEFEPVKWYNSVIKPYCKPIFGWVKDIGEPRDWHESYLTLFEKVSDGKWHIKVIEPYMD